MINVEKLKIAFLSVQDAENFLKNCSESDSQKKTILRIFTNIALGTVGKTQLLVYHFTEKMSRYLNYMDDLSTLLTILVEKTC